MILLNLVSAHVSEAAPARWGLATNTDTRECAGYWAGDEFVSYGLPEGWKAYYPTYSAGSDWGTIRTDIGECGFQIRKEEACCMELGYAFVSDNIGKDQKTVLRDRDAFEKELELQREHGNNAYRSPFGRLVAYGVLLFGCIGVVIAAIRFIRKKR